MLEHPPSAPEEGDIWIDTTQKYTFTPYRWTDDLDFKLFVAALFVFVVWARWATQ